MSILTPHLKLVKPEASDNVTPNIFASNFETIDAEIFDLKTDYVVAQGKQGDWIYRRWNSGIGECWGRYQQTTQNLYNGYTQCGIGNYPFAFTEIPVITATFAVTAQVSSAIAHVSSTMLGPNVFGRNNNAGVGVECFFNLYVVGRWK